MLHNPSILGGPQTKGDKIRSGFQKHNEDCPGFLNSTGRLGPKRGQKCYVTPAFSGVPKQRGQNQIPKPMLGVTMMPLVSQSMGL